MLELDIIVGRWAKANLPNLSLEECTDFSKEILETESPVLIKYLTGEKPIPENLKEGYLPKLKNYAYSNDFLNQ